MFWLLMAGSAFIECGPDFHAGIQCHFMFSLTMMCARVKHYNLCLTRWHLALAARIDAHLLICECSCWVGYQLIFPKGAANNIFRQQYHRPP